VDETHVLGMLVSGVYGYLLKSEPVAVILEAARAVARGELRFSTGIADRIFGRLHTAVSVELTEREVSVLRLAAAGWCSKEIARKLGVTESTVGFHLGNVYRKIGARPRVQAAMWAMKHGLVPPPRKYREIAALGTPVPSGCL
jgi:DNA-binding NarL/FixJ family response regulator